MSILTNDRLRHLVLAGTAVAKPFTQPGQGSRRGSTYPQRDPGAHGMALAAQLSLVANALASNQDRRAAQGFGEVTGSYITFELIPNTDLSLDSLEHRSAGIERVAFLMSKNGKGMVTVFVPEGKLHVFETKLVAYLDPEKSNANGKRRNEALLNSIEHIRRTVLRDLWTDPVRDFPTAAGPLWWELWIRQSVEPDLLREKAGRLGIIIGSQTLRFADRTIVLAHATVDQMVLSVELLDSIAELRSARSLACELLDLTRREENDRITDLRRRIRTSPKEAPAVCILDTGIDVGHPLLEPGLSAENAHSYNPGSWGVDDRHGHGTQMAGFALFGDRLEELLVSDEELALRHQLESVKILRAPGTNPPEMYGVITLAAAARVEVQNVARPRVFSLSVTDPETRSPKGQPSSWSAALDLLGSGAAEEGSPRRLLFVSSGNTGCGAGYDYPDFNHTDPIHDPGQSWDAVTVGAYTEKDVIHESDCSHWSLVAPAGDMSPCNTTSLVWDAEWPNKPDLVLEGGNMAWEPSRRIPEFLDSLSLLTTRRRQDSRILCRSGETSAATACAARLGACAPENFLRGEFPRGAEAKRRSS